MVTPFDGKSMGDDHTETCLAFPQEALAAPISRYTAGSVLAGKYRLDSLLGEGGMGAVWRASNLLLDLPVAIKLIRADLDRNALRARLQLEARSVAKLGHPAIVRIYDVGETESGDPFIVMELLHGDTLAQVLAQGRLPAQRAVQLVLPIIDACVVAHARGIVHRDLKPDNLLIALEDQRLQPKILDFGIAKLTDPRDADHRLTEIGTVVGSPDYMSPEQARGRDDVDYRTDIWSVCVVLYEAITGSAPFSAPNYNALLRAIVEDAPKSLADHAAGDAELWAILQRGLAKERQERHRSMAELGRALAAWLVNHGVHEDACGTSIEPKWLGRASDPSSLGAAGPSEESPESRPAMLFGFNSKVTHDPPARKRGVDSRGPFTATIRRDSGSRRRALRAAAFAGSLIGALALTLALVSGPARRSAAAQPVAPPERGGPALPRGETAPSPVERATSSLATAGLAAPSAPTRTAVVPAPKSPPPAVRSARLASTAVPNLPLAAASTARPAPPIALKSSPRDLDLISPY
jgi:serine/threonine-protein kinase